MVGKSNPKTSETKKVAKSVSKKEVSEEVVDHVETETVHKDKKLNKKNVAKTSSSTTKSKSEKVTKSTPQEQDVVVEVSDAKFTPQLLLFQTEIKAVREKLQTLTSILKKLDACYKQDIKRVRKHKQKRNGPHKPTGFAKQQVVPEKLAKFIGVNSGDELTGPEITSKVWQQLKDRGLTYDKDKRVFRTDDTVTDLFGVSKVVNRSTDHRDKNGFNFCNLQKFIAHALGKESKDKPKSN
jgi:chromatin remodeling complex protein RSC6